MQHDIKVVSVRSSDLLEMCQAYEAKNGMSSSEFFARYKAGEFRDDPIAARWAGYWREYIEMLDRRSMLPTKLLATV